MHHKAATYVTRPALPPLQELLPLLEDIWASRILSNDGPYHKRFEQALAEYLGTPHLVLVSNATIGLLLALRHSGMTGKVITTPFSFVGTSHALAWAGLEPVFADIDPDSLNLDPGRIEAALSDDVTGLLPMHCFGIPCDTAAISALAARHDLQVIYDAAHAFGVTDRGGSVLRHGAASVLSFHATKVFNTFEGGAIVCRDAEQKLALDRLKSFGIVDESRVESVGLNGKLNEFQAALGCVQLAHVDRYIEARRAVDARYRKLLGGIPGVRLFAPHSHGKSNYYSFPLMLTADYPYTCDEVLQRLRATGIHARRYFNPLISDFPMYRHLPSAAPENLPVASDISARILCLPLFPDLSEEVQQRICALFR